MTKTELINQVSKLIKENKIMWWNKKLVEKPQDEKQEEIKSLNATIRELRREKMRLQETIEEAKFKKRLEQEEVVHINKLERERMKQELDSEKAIINKKYSEDITTFKEQQRKELVESLREFHNKMESRFNTELKNLKEVYGLLMEKLPNVNFAITKNIGEPSTTGGDRPLIETSGTTKNKR